MKATTLLIVLIALLGVATAQYTTCVKGEDKKCTDEFGSDFCCAEMGGAGQSYWFCTSTALGKSNYVENAGVKVGW